MYLQLSTVTTQTVTYRHPTFEQIISIFLTNFSLSMSPGTRQACADKQRQHPKHHEVVASNRLEAANIYHRQKLNIAGCIFDIFIAGRSLLIDIEPLLKDKANKEKLARILGLTYRTISKGECTNIASLVKFMPFVSDYKERNGKAFEKAKQIIQTIQERRNNGTGR